MRRTTRPDPVRPAGPGPHGGATSRWARRLSGPAPTLPAPVDAALEAWARAPAPVRLLVRGAAIVVVLLALVWPDAPADTRRVLRTTRALDLAAVLGPDDVEVVDVPADLLPDAVLPADTSLGALHLRGPLPRGAVLSEVHVTTGGVAGDVTDERVAAPVRVTDQPFPPIGALVDVHLVGPDGRVATLALAARVLRHDDGAVWLSASREEAVALATTSTGTAYLVVLPAPG